MARRTRMPTDRERRSRYRIAYRLFTAPGRLERLVEPGLGQGEEDVTSAGGHEDVRVEDGAEGHRLSLEVVRVKVVLVADLGHFVEGLLLGG